MEEYSYPVKSKIKTIIFIAITFVALIFCIFEIINLNNDPNLAMKGLENYRMFVIFFILPITIILFVSSVFYTYNNFTELHLFPDTIVVKRLMQKDEQIRLNSIDNVSYSEWLGRLKITTKDGAKASVFLHLDGFKDFVEKTQNYFKNFVGIDFTDYQTEKSKEK